MSRDLEDLLAEYFERVDAGESLRPEAFAADHPDVEEPLLRALRAMQDTDDLLTSELAEAPQAIGPYRLVGALGRGAMGRVFRAVHPDRPDEFLALKVLNVAASLDPRALARFRRECETLASLQHPGIVRVRDTGVEGGAPYLVMDLVEGQSLASRIETARAAASTSRSGARVDRLELPGEGEGWRRACRLVATMARSLHEAHRQGLLHRDLKPSNVLLRASDGAPIVVDFGMAGHVGHGSLTRTGDVLGTPHFMAPEQARGEALDARTDVYALGAILFEMLTLSVPYPDEDPMRVLEAVRRGPPRPIRSHDPALPTSLEHIVRRAMAHRASRRYATAAEFADVLDAIAHGRSLPRATLSLAGRIEDAWSWHHRRLLVGAAVAAVALIGWFVWQLAEERDRDDFAAALREATLARVERDQEARVAAGQRMLALRPDSVLARWFAGESDPDRLVGDPFVEAMARGDLAWRARDRDEALAHFSRALERQPDSPIAVALVGMSARRASRPALAVRELLSAVRLLPESTELRHELGWAYRAEGRFGDAAAQFEAAIRIEPDDADHWHNLARMRAYEHEFALGLEAVEKALEIGAAEDRMLYLRTKAALLDGAGRSADAIPILREVAEFERTPNSLQSLALALDRNHEMLEAITVYREMLELEPDRIAGLVNLAFLHAGSKSDECEDCARFFEEHPVVLDPDRVEGYALRYLDADHARYEFLETVAASCARVARTERLRVRIEALLDEDFDAEVLGRLVRGRKRLP